MVTIASGPFTEVNDWLNSDAVPAGITVGGTLAIVGTLWAAFRGRRGVGWRVVYDQRLNH